MKGKKEFTREDIDYEIESKRDSFSKVYQLKNGHKIMTITSEPQHYKGKDGKYAEFSNELIESEEGLCATRGDCKMILPDGARNTGKVKIASDECGVEWELVKPIGRKRTKMTAPEVKLENRTDEKAAKADAFAPEAHHKAKYKDVLEGIDIEYEVLNNGIKENIIINEAVENPTFTFSMKATGLVPLEDKTNKTIEFYEKIDGDELGDKKFVIPAPFMIDAAGAVSDSVSYTIKEKTDGEYEFTVLVDKEWVNDEERVYPVTVDPYIHYYSIGTLSVSHSGGNVKAGFMGNKSFGTDLNVYMSGADVNHVLNAILCLTPISVDSNAEYRLYCESGSDSVPIGFDINTFTYCADITHILKSAAMSGSQSLPLTLGAELSCPGHPTPDVYYGKITFSSNVCVIVQYHESGYYENNQSFVGDALVGSVNLSNGKLLFNQEDCHTGSAAIPFALSHYYSIDKKDDAGSYGKGWNLSINQKVEWIGGNTVTAKYTDGTGMVHYFADGKDLGGLDMGLTRENERCTVITKDGTRLSFNLSGLLTQVKDINDNTITITRNSSGNISKITDSFGREMTLTYSSGKLIRVTDPSNRAICYTYDSNGLLTGVSYPDGSTVDYTYINNALSTIKNRDNTITSYTYSGSRVTKVEKYPAGSSISSSDPEEYLDIEYQSAGSTAVSDRSGIRKVYVFDDCGRAQVIYEDTPLVVNGKQISNRFQVTGTTVYNYTGTKRTFASSIRSCDESNNLVMDGSFENYSYSAGSNNYWTFHGSYAIPCGVSDCDGIVREDSVDHSKSFKFVGNPSKKKQLKQTIPGHRVTLKYGDSLILSAWAKAKGAYTKYGEREDFYISATAHYTDGTVGDENIAYFVPSCRGWQYGATAVRIDKTKELSHIEITLDYSYMGGTCLFDHVRLTNSPATSAVYEDDIFTPSSAVIFGKSNGFYERVTAHDGIYTVVEERDINHNVLRRTVTDLNGHSFVSVFEYDNKRRLIRTQNERNIITEYTYNSVGMQTSVKSYYWAEFNPDFVTGVIHPTDYFKSETEYDSTGEFSVGVSDQRDENIKTQNSYNTTSGLLNSSATPNGQVTNYTYDPNSDLVTGVSAMIGSTEYSVLYGYTNNKLTSITHNGFNYGFTYDGMGRSKKVMIAGEDYTENSYVLTDTTTVSTTYAGGEVMTVETDRKDQPVKRTYTDKAGNETVLAEGEYDTLGKPVKVVDKITNKEYTYVYDGYENVTEEKVNGVTFKRCAYDVHNRLSSTKFYVLGETQTYRPIYDKRASDHAVYSDNGVVGITLDGVFTEKAEHDEYGRATEKKLTLGSAVSPLFKDSYTYLDTQLGFEKRLTTMVAEVERRVGGTVKDVLKYTYDNNGNITEIKNGDELLAKYTYDGLNQLIREDNAVFSKTYTFAYDAGGNILEKKTYFYSAGEPETLIDTKTYTYAATGWKDRLTSYNGETITYDALGNPLTYKGHSLTWARISNLASYDTLTFDYDASGIRTRKGNITYTLDGNRILAETRPSGTIKYYYGTTGVIGFEYNNIKYYYLKNAQGDITAIYDEGGNLKAEYEYDAWGNHVITVDADGIGTINPFRYRGYYYDTETGLYYLNARYYDPEIGRFINADDQIEGVGGESLGYNMFVYCMNNPINMSDSTGNWPKWLSGALNVVGGALQVAAGAALGATVGWTGLGAVAACFLIVNGTATSVQGIGQIVNDVTKSNVMREDNIVRTGVKEAGRAIGGDTGAKVAGGAYDVAVIAANIYAGRVGLQQAGKIPVKVNINNVVNNPLDEFVTIGPADGVISQYCRTIPQSGYGEIYAIQLKNGLYQIVNGHHRVAALRRLGYETIKIFLTK